MRLQAKFCQLGVLGVVVVFLRFHSRVRQVVYDDIESESRACSVNQFGEFADRKLFRELVEYAKLSACGGIHACEFDATNGIANVEESARLSAFPVDRERMLDGGLHAEAVECRAEHL